MVVRRERITSDDVARAAGVSRSTVSRVLSGAASEMVSSETRERISRLAVSMGYVPNAAARQLRMGRARAIGLLLPSVTHYLTGTYAFGEFLRGAAEVTDAAGYSLLLCPTSPSGRSAQAFPTGQVDGVLLIHPLKDDPAFAQILSTGAPAVLMNRVPDELGLCWVDVDNEGGAREAVLHLLERGHRRIGLISGRPGFTVTELRLRGYRSALAGFGLAPDDALSVFVPEPRLAPEGAAAMRRLLALPAPPTAVLCLPDQLAVGARRAAKEAGLRIPADLAIVGFDDDPASAYEQPLLTTVRADLRAKARSAATMLIDLIEGRISDPTSVLLPMTLIVRESS